MTTPANYDRLVGPYLEDLRAYCMCLTKCKWDGEDLFQETLLKSLVYFAHTEPYVEVKPFLIRVARNLWIDQCRAARRRRTIAGPHLTLCHKDSDYASVRGLLEWMAGWLPKRSIEMWLLSAYFGYTMAEIAEDMQCTVPAVKSVLFRTREALREHRAGQDRRGQRAVVRFEVERWSKALLTDRPQYLRAQY